jgi:hypothetical protein
LRIVIGILSFDEVALFGGSKRKDDNEVWAIFHPSDEDLSLGTPVFRRNPKGRGQFSPFLPCSSLQEPVTARSSRLEPGKLAAVAIA